MKDRLPGVLEKEENKASLNHLIPIALCENYQ